MEEKTNVMRLLDGKKIVYRSHCYIGTDAISGSDVAAVLNEDPNQVFKTLVTVGKSGGHFVFLVPVNRELDLKKAAKCAGEKKLDMLKSKDLLPLTGYIHGGCSPIGMKKAFPIFLHQTAGDFDTILFSAGKIGYQVELSPEHLKKILRFQLADLVEQEP